MNKSYDNYEIRLVNLINKLRENTIKEELDKNNLKEEKFEKKNNDNIEKKNDRLKCKQFDTINYCYEMYKVRKNKKADFDIYSTQKYNIEDEDIDKIDKIQGWKELDNKIKEELLENYIDKLDNSYINLSRNYIKDFVIKNKTKVKYNKKDKQIDDILGMCYLNNELIIKKKKQNSNVTIDKLRKSIKSNF